MLCNKQSEVGSIGACFFVGIMISMMWAPKTSDKIGRYPMICITLLAQMIALIGIYYSNSIKQARCAMALLGMSHPGKNIIFFNYLLENLPQAKKQATVTLIMVT